jgi:hypothetical protein
MIDVNLDGAGRRRGLVLGMVILVLVMTLVALLLKGDFHERGNAPNYSDTLIGI